MKEMVGAILGYKAEALGEDASIDRINHQIVHNADEGWMPILVHEDKIIFERWRDIIVADDANEAFSTRKFTRRILRPLPIYGNSRPDLSNGDVFTIIMAHHDADESMQPGEFIELLDLTMDPWMLGKIMYVEYLPFKNIEPGVCANVPRFQVWLHSQNGNDRSHPKWSVSPYRWWCRLFHGRSWPGNWDQNHRTVYLNRQFNN